MTDDGLVLSRPHRSAYVGGEQRIYRWGMWGLSVVNGAPLHSFRFAWEAAVIRFTSDNNDDFELVYTTPLTRDVAIFDTDEEANAFVALAKAWFTEWPWRRMWLAAWGRIGGYVVVDACWPMPVEEAR